MDVNIRTMEERDLPAASRIYNQSAVATTYSYTCLLYTSDAADE